MAEHAMQARHEPEVSTPGLGTAEGSAEAEGQDGRGAVPPLVLDIAEQERLPAPSKRIVVIDERAFRRECVVRMLREVSPEYSIAALERPCDPRPDELARAGGERIDVVILDTGWIRLPDERVASDVRFLQDRFEGSPIILLSDREDSAHVAQALSYGVRGFIPTSLGAGVVAEAVRLVGAGGTFVPASALVHALGVRRDGTGRGSGGGSAGLTPRECEVLNLLREGKPNKIIAATLELKETTVKIHVRHIMKKLKATNRTEAALMAERAL
jgi:DNA-binding NarL/FixJ family response regulator